MVSRKEDKIDFSKLEREVYAAVAADEKYQRENDAKFRAVNQKVATYDEFRDIVLASHLKPLDKNERVEKVSDKFTHTWNACVNGNTTNDKIDQLSTSANEKKHPRNSLEFTREWRKKTSNGEKYTFLRDLGVKNLEQIFKSEVSLLGDILLVLNSECKDEHHQEIVEILKTVSKMNRFSLSISFLNVDEMQACKSLFDKLTESIPNRTDEITVWTDLKKLYKI